MMSDLIKREDAITAIAEQLMFEANCDSSYASDDINDWKDVAERWLKDVPTAEPKIIRCKDCKNWDTTWQNDWATLYHYCPLIDGTRKGDWYCADAERRTDE